MEDQKYLVILGDEKDVFDEARLGRHIDELQKLGAKIYRGKPTGTYTVSAGGQTDQKKWSRQRLDNYFGKLKEAYPDASYEPYYEWETEEYKPSSNQLTIAPAQTAPAAPAAPKGGYKASPGNYTDPNAPESDFPAGRPVQAPLQEAEEETAPADNGAPLPQWQADVMAQEVAKMSQRAADTAAQFPVYETDFDLPFKDEPEVKPIRNFFESGWQATKRLAGNALQSATRLAKQASKRVAGPLSNDAETAQLALDLLNQRVEAGEDPFTVPTKKPQGMTDGQYDALINASMRLALLSGSNKGDVNAVRAQLEQDAKRSDVVDKVDMAAEDIIAKNERPVEGFWGKMGELLPMMVGTGLGIAAGAATKSPAVASAIGKATFGTFAASSAGEAMRAAKQRGATDSQTLGAGLASAAIMYGIGKIPFGKLTGSVTKAASREAAEGVTAALANSSTKAEAARELENLAKIASKELGLNAGKYAKDYVGHILTSGGSFASMGALNAMVPLIYENPDDYPVLSSVMKGALDGAVDGVVMGALFGIPSTYAEYAFNKNRWKKQGGAYAGVVDFGDGTDVFVKDGDAWKPVDKGDLGQRVTEIVGFEPGNERGKASAFYVLADNKLYRVPADALKNYVKFTPEQVDEAAKRYGQKNKSAASESTRLLPDGDAYGGVKEAAMDAEGQEAFDKVQQQAGKDITYHGNGEFAGSEVVEGISPSGESFYITGDRNEVGEYPVVYPDGRTGFVKASEVTARGYAPGEYGKTMVMEEKAAAEKERMSAEVQGQIEAVREKFEQEYSVQDPADDLVTKIFASKGEALPEWASGPVFIGDANEQRVVITTDRGATHPFTWEEIAPALGASVEIKTDADMEAEQAGIVAAQNEARAGIAAQLDESVKNEATLQDGGKIVEINPGSIDLANGTVDAIIEYPDGSRVGKNVPYSEILAMQQAAAGVSEVPAEPAAPEAPAEVPAAEEAPKEPETPAAPAYETPMKDGEVDWDKMLEENPAEFARQLDELNEGDSTMSRAAINERLFELKDKRDKTKATKVNEIVGLQKQIKALESVMNSYPQGAQDLSRQAEKKAQKTGSNEKAYANEPTEPQTPEELASEYFRTLSRNNRLKGKLNREDFKREVPGWSNHELGKFFPWWAKKGMGRTLVELAEDMANDFDEQYGLIPLDINADKKDVQVARDAIIELLRQSASPSDVFGYTGRQHGQHRTDDQRMDLDEADRECLALYGRTAAEQMQIEAQQDREVLEVGDYYDELQEEINNFTADYYAIYGSSEEETARELSSDAQGGTEDMRDLGSDQARGIEILEGRQTDSSPTDGRDVSPGRGVRSNASGSGGGNPDRRGKDIVEAGRGENPQNSSSAEVIEDMPSDEEFAAMEAQRRAEEGNIEENESRPAEAQTNGTSQEFPGERPPTVDSILAQADKQEEPGVVTYNGIEYVTGGLTGQDMAELWANKDATKDEDGKKQGRIDIVQAIFDANPEINSFDNEGQQLIAIENVYNLAKQYPDLAISKEILSRVKEAPAIEQKPAEKAAKEAKTEARKPVTVEDIFAMADAQNRATEKTEKTGGAVKVDTRIEDFGEKIGGARKDTVRERILDSRSLSRKDLSELKDPDKILSRANIIKAASDGRMTDADARTLLAMNMTARAAHSVIKPHILAKYRDMASAWADGQAVRFEVNEADLDARISELPEDIRKRDGIREKVRKDFERYGKMLEDYAKTYEAIDYPSVKRKLGSAYVAHYSFDDRFWVKSSPSARRGWPFVSFDSAVEKLKSSYPELPESNTKKSGSGEEKDSVGNLSVVKDQGGWYRVKSRDIPGQIYFSKTFHKREEAEAYLKEHAGKLQELERRMSEALMGSNIGLVAREGLDYRDGKDVTPEDFLSTFGFRGGEFGNWVPQAERQEYLNKTYDAIMDFCHVVGISPRAFSLGGTLGIAFGARGHSKAVAHYEPSKTVINLTRMRGAGSLAHEWFHALDNNLPRQETGNVTDMATQGDDTRRQETAAAFRELVRKMDGLDYTKRSSRAGDYWGSVEERAARLFEGYIAKKLGAADTVSPLLVREQAETVEVEDGNIQGAWPFPTKEEVNEIEPYFDDLFSTLQEETDAEGNAILFSFGDTSESHPASSTDRKVIEIAARNMAKKLHVEVAFDENAFDKARNLGGVMVEPKGWYDTATGVVHLNMGRISDVYDATMVMLHESVGHYGLRAMFGENFNTFLDNVYANASPDIRKSIANIAEKYGINRNAATEEYLARLAEEGFTDEEERSFFQRIKEWFLELLRKVGAFIKELTDEDLRYILWESRRNLEEGDLLQNAENAIVRARLREQAENSHMERAWHGSGARFARFDSSHMGEGEGAQAHGWGHYVAFSPETSKGYAIYANNREVNAVEERILRQVITRMQEIRDKTKNRNIKKEEKQALNDEYGKLDNLLNFILRKVKPKNMAIEEYLSGDNQDVIDNASTLMEHLINREKNPLSIQMAIKEAGHIKSTANEFSPKYEAAKYIAGTKAEDWETGRHLYEVEIPKDNGRNYLYEAYETPEDMNERILRGIENYPSADSELFLRKLAEFDAQVESSGMRRTGKATYDLLTSFAFHGHPRQTSRFLNNLGIVGIRYIGGRDGECAVIFSDGNVHIVDREMFSFGRETDTPREQRENESNQQYSLYRRGEYEKKYNITAPDYIMEYPDRKSVREFFGDVSDEQADKIAAGLVDASNKGAHGAYFPGLGKILIFGSLRRSGNEFDVDLMHESIHDLDHKSGSEYSRALYEPLLDLGKTDGEIAGIIDFVDRNYREENRPKELMAYVLSNKIVSGKAKEIVKQLKSIENERRNKEPEDGGSVSGLLRDSGNGGTGERTPSGNDTGAAGSVSRIVEEIVRTLTDKGSRESGPAPSGNGGKNQGAEKARKVPDVNPVSKARDAASGEADYSYGDSKAYQAIKREGGHVSAWLRNAHTTQELYSNAAEEYNVIMSRPGTLITEQHQNMYKSVFAALEAIEKETGRKAEDYEDFRLLATTKERKTEEDQTTFLDKHYLPLTKTITELSKIEGVDYDDIVEYVELKHGLERNIELAARDSLQDYERMYDEKSRKILAENDALRKQGKGDGGMFSGLTAEDIDQRIRDNERRLKKLDEELDGHRKVLFPARYHKDKHDAGVKKVRSDKSLTHAEKSQKIEELDREYRAFLYDFETHPRKYELARNRDERFSYYRGTDGVEGNDGTDYSAIRSWFAEYRDADGKLLATTPARKTGESKERYNARLRAMRHVPEEARAVTDAEALARKWVEEFEGKIGAERRDDLWKKINGATDAILKHQFDNHMMDRARYEYLKDRFKYYVPLRGFDETTAEDIWDYSRENHSGDFTAPLKAVKGRQSKPAAPFAYIRAMANSAFMHDNQNALRLAILRFVANRPEQQLITVSDSWYTDSGQTDDDGNVLWEPRYPQIDPDMTMEEREEAVRKFEEEMRELEMQGKAVMGDKRLNLRGAVVHIDEEDKHRHMVRVMHLGKEKFLVFNGNPRAAIALNGLLNIEGKRGKMAGARAVTRFMSAMNTSYSPKFWFRNLSKDFFTGLFNTTINEDASYLGKYVKNYAHVLGNMPIMARRGEFKDNPNWSKEERARVKRICDLYKTYVKNGGPTGYATVTRTEEYEAELQRLVQKGKMKQVEQAKAIWNWVRKIGDLAEIFEQVPRFATFITSREEGRSIERSIKDAKDVTLDFNMKGAATHTGMDYIKKLQHQKRNGEFRDLTAVERVFYYALANLSPYARACIMFFNPAVQSVEKTIRNYKNHPWKASGLGLALIASGFLQGMLDTFFAPDGDDEKKDIGKIRNQGEYKRSSNAIIRLSKTFFLTLPLSPEFAVFHELGVQLFDVLYHRYGPEDKPVYDAVKTLTNTLPLDPLNPVDWTPSLVRPALEAATNKDFRGAKIAYNNTFNKDVPGWRKSPDSTWDWFLALSQWANEASGGDYSKKGWANFNPAQWQHVLEGMGGGLLRDVIGAADEVGRLVGDEDWDFRHTVLLSNFFLNTKDYKDGYTYQLFNQFYDLGADANRRHNQYIKEGDIIRRFEIEGTREWAYWEIYQDKYKKAIDALKKELKSGGQGKDERQVRSDALYELYGSYAQECMDLFYDRDWKEK